MALKKVDKERIKESARLYERKKYDVKYAAMLLVSRAEGWSVQSFCKQIEISKQQYYDWVRDYEDFRSAAGLAKTAAEAHWLQMGEDNLQNKLFNAALYKYLTAVMFGWNELVNTDEHIKESIKQKLDDKVVKEIEAIKAQYKKDV